MYSADESVQSILVYIDCLLADGKLVQLSVFRLLTTKVTYDFSHVHILLTNLHLLLEIQPL